MGTDVSVGSMQKGINLENFGIGYKKGKAKGIPGSACLNGQGQLNAGPRTQ